VSASTATGTTATAERPARRAGRFAPSPTGALHLGSITTAAASFLDARHDGARWLLRIEDLDTARVIPGAADLMLRQLEALGFEWDGPVVHQSTRLDLYAQALAELRAHGLTYECSCSRRERGGTDDVGGYAGTCRAGPTRPGPTAVRFRADYFSTGAFIDRLRGPIDVSALAKGDPIVRRRDGCFAYQLAVVVDDAAQGITDVVRGDDLLPSTAWQRALQRALRLSDMSYAHLPLVCERDGTKLSKSKHALAAAGAREAGNKAPQLLWRVLRLLRQQPPQELADATHAELWEWAIANWRINALRGVATLPAD
jgi:glutamyl-Q tRNA(Asp) synthetase